MRLHLMETKFINSVNCKCFHLRTEPSRHFAYEIHVKWSSGQSAVIYRRYSQFFNLQCKLLDTFPHEAGSYNPSKRTLPFLPGKRILGNISEKVAEKRRKKFDSYLNALTQLPNIGCSALVLQFFDSKESDLTSLFAKRTSSVKRVSFKGKDITNPVSFPQYIAVESYKKSQHGELSITAGAIVLVIEKKHTGWWLAQTQDGEEQGWVPASFLDLVYNEIESDEDELATLPSEPEQFITTSGYTAIGRDELSVLRGCVVDVINKTLDGWWTCRYQGKVGVFPSAYLKKANTLKAQQLLNLSKKVETEKVRPLTSSVNNRDLSHYAPPRRDISKPKPPRPPAPAVMTESVYVAIAGFSNTMADGIDLTEGTRVKVLSKDDSGWWFVEIGGAKGWAPSTYVQPVPPSTAKAVNKPSKPARPARQPTVTTSPKVEPKFIKKSVSVSAMQSAGSSVRSVNNNNVERGNLVKNALSTNNFGVRRSSQPSHTAKPSIPKKPSLAGAHSQPILNGAVDQAESESQLSVAELRRKLSSNLFS